MENIEERCVLKGLIASTLLLAFYIVVATLFGGFAFAIDNFVKLWYWMVPLIVGFGIQIGLFFYVIEQMHRKATAQAAASTGISATSMVACCAHHIADIAPFLGITTLGLFLTKYQSTFLLAGVFSNILGITYMVSLLNTRINKNKIKTLMYSLLIISIFAIFLSYYFISKNENIINQNNLNTGQSSFQPIINENNNVEFQVTPLSLSEFRIEINTHSVNLDFDLTKISTLYDDIGNEYKPLSWEGSERGGHHRSGVLKFSAIDKNIKSIKLVIIDSAKREFEWDLE